MKDFMPGDDVIAGIKADLDRYEAERSQTRRAVMWRVPVFLALFLLAVVGIAYFLNMFADPNEQWFSPLHVFLYGIAFFTAFAVYRAARSPARKLQQSFRERVLPAVFGFIEDVRYKHNQTPISSSDCRTGSWTATTSSVSTTSSGRYEDFPFRNSTKRRFRWVGTSKAMSSRRHRRLRDDRAVPWPAGGDAQGEQGRRLLSRPVRQQAGRPAKRDGDPGRKLRLPHRQCRGCAPVGDGAAGAGVAMAWRDVAGTAGAWR